MAPKKSATAAAAAVDDEPVDPARRGVIYVGHLPEGFYEDALRGYFSQFGTLRSVYVSRSTRTGRVKGFAFVRFEDEAAAAVAAETMNGYPLGGKVLACSVVDPRRVTPVMLQDASDMELTPTRTFMRKKIVAAQKRRAAERREDTRAARLLKQDAATNAKVRAAGIDYVYERPIIVPGSAPKPAAADTTSAPSASVDETAAAPAAAGGKRRREASPVPVSDDAASKRKAARGAAASATSAAKEPPSAPPPAAAVAADAPAPQKSKASVRVEAKSVLAAALGAVGGPDASLSTAAAAAKPVREGNAPAAKKPATDSKVAAVAAPVSASKKGKPASAAPAPDAASSAALTVLRPSSAGKSPAAAADAPVNTKPVAAEAPGKSNTPATTPKTQASAKAGAVSASRSSTPAASAAVAPISAVVKGPKKRATSGK